MKYVWLTIVSVSLGVAATFLWWQRTDIAFVAGTLALVAWFLNYRARLKKILDDEPEPEIDKKDSDPE